MVPTMMQRIWNLDTAERARYDMRSLKVLWHLAAPCPGWLKEAFIDWLGPETIWELYGGTEGQGSTVIGGNEWLLHKGSVGQPGAHCEMKIVDETARLCHPVKLAKSSCDPEPGQAPRIAILAPQPRASKAAGRASAIWVQWT